MDENLSRDTILNALDPDRMRKSDFVKSFEAATKLFVELKEWLTNKAEELADAVETAKQAVENKADQAITRIEAKTDAKLATVTNGINGLNGKDGENPDPEIIVNEVLNRIKLPEYRAPIMDGPEEMRNKLELLAPEERPYAADTIALIKRLESLESNISSKVYGGYTPLVRNLYNQSFAETPNGVRTTFTMVKAPKNTNGVAIYQNRTRAHLTEDFTISGKTVTFLVAPLTGDLLIYDLTY